MLLGSLAVWISACGAVVATEQPAATAPTVPATRPGQTSAEERKAQAMPTLLVGDRAPAIGIQRWVKGTPIEKLESGKVAIVEFWASWCTPCASSIPRLTDLQARFKDKGVAVIGIASQEVAGADLDRFVAAQGDRLAYSVALDNNGATHQSWMVAAGQNSIPTAFLVDAQGRIAWIGHPLEGLEDATVQVLEGRFDLAAATVTYRARLELLMRAQPTIDRFREHADVGEHELAIAAADELLAMDPKQFGQYAWLRFQVMAIGQKDYAGAYKYADEAIGGVLKDNADVLALLATTICDDMRIERRDFAVVDRAATRANELTQGRRSDVLAALARVAAESGDWTAAIDWQSKAAAIAPKSPAKTEMERRLAEYRGRAERAPAK